MRENVTGYTHIDKVMKIYVYLVLSVSDRIHRSTETYTLSLLSIFPTRSISTETETAMAASARRASPPSSSSSGAASHAPPTYDWEVALENDRRMPKMQQFVNTILHANFSTVQEKLRKEEPPARRHEPAPAPAPALEASGNGHAHLGPKQARMTLQPDPSASPTQLPGYMSESSSEVDMREVDPMDELSDFEPHPHDTPEQQGNGAVERSHAPPNRADDGDDDMNGGANDFEPGEDDNEDDDVRSDAIQLSFVVSLSCAYKWIFFVLPLTDMLRFAE